MPGEPNSIFIVSDEPACFFSDSDFFLPKQTAEFSFLFPNFSLVVFFLRSHAKLSTFK